jgi:hypothetical protein
MLAKNAMIAIADTVLVRWTMVVREKRRASS